MAFLRHKIDKLVGLSFISPYILSFLIAEFVLVMQFLWKYIDDITGKGISTLEIMELVFYFALTLIPRAIPISILLSSVFVFGNMSEKFELTSLKSCGVSLTRVMRTGIFLAVMTALFSILASNLIVPRANYKFFSRFDAIRRHKPALSIEEAMFNDDFYRYKIYVGKKYKDGKTVEDVLIYDQTATDISLVNIISAKKGIMEISNDGRYFMMNLMDGEQYRELKETKNEKTEIEENKFPFTRTKFKEWQKVFDMSEFDLNSNAVNLNRRKYDLMNTVQLLEAIDSIKEEKYQVNKTTIYGFNQVLKYYKAVEEEPIKNPSTREIKTSYKPPAGHPLVNANILLRNDVSDLSQYNTFVETFKDFELSNLIKPAHIKAQRIHLNMSGMNQKLLDLNFQEDRFILKLNQQYSWAFVCIIFLFVGAPFGAIIRKGGYGYPLLMAIIIFMLFIILMNMGEKLQRSQYIDPVTAAWLPCIVLAPFAAVLTYKALTDSKVFYPENYLKFLKYFN